LRAEETERRAMWLSLLSFENVCTRHEYRRVPLKSGDSASTQTLKAERDYLG